jgi:hypothetical protein
MMVLAPVQLIFAPESIRIALALQVSDATQPAPVTPLLFPQSRSVIAFAPSDFACWRNFATS